MDHLRHKAFWISTALGASLIAPAQTPYAQEISVQQPQEAMSAKALQTSGAYEKAIEKGRAEATVEGYVAAAKSGLFLAAYQEKDKKAARRLLAAATKDAQTAVSLAPEHIDANLQLAIAEGYAARIKVSPGRAKKARERAEWLVEAAPGNGYVLGLLGGWHGEAVAAFGKLIADVTVGASTADFETYFDAAVDAAPNNALITAYYARLLLAINDPGMSDKAAKLLGSIETAAPQDAFEIFMKERALDLKAALNTGDRKTLKKLIKAQRPFRGQK
jgi:tetratricopeptide (TPR) repeat protein